MQISNWIADLHDLLFLFEIDKMRVDRIISSKKGKLHEIYTF